MEIHQAPGGQFEGIEAILSIAARGPLTGRLWRNDLVLSAAYADYLKLLDMAERGWTDEDLQELDSLLWKYTTAYVKEKCTGDLNNERNVVSLRLLNHFFSQKGIPAEVYQVLWNKFDLNAAIFGRSKVLHGTLRDLCLERAPEVCGPRENFTELTKAFDAITYHQNVSEEELRRQVDALFAREDFQRAVRNRSFMQDHTFWAGASTGVYFLNRLIALYEEHPELPLARTMQEHAQAAIQGMEDRRQREAEAQRLHQLAQEEITPGSCTLSNPLFFRWYLQAAFFQAEDQEGNALMNTVMQELPSLPQWDRRLADQGFSHSITLERRDGDQIEEAELTALFHQFYIEYHFDGQPLSTPVLPFWSMQEMEDDQLFLFLPIMAAFQSELDQVTDCIQKRLARLGVTSETLLSTLADAIAWEVACLVEQEGTVTVTQPAFFGRETDGALCFCQWYSASNQLLTIRRSLDGLELLHEYCREEVFSLQQAEALAGTILDELFSPEQAVILPSSFPYDVQADYFCAPSRTWVSTELNSSLIEQLLQEFQNKKIDRLAFSTASQYHIVLLWNTCRPGAASTCALLRFDDRGRRWEALISDRDAYMNTDCKQTQHLPFRMGKLAAYRLHQAPKKLVNALIALLNGQAPDPGQWSTEVYLNNALQRYYVARRTVGGFPYDRDQMYKTLRNRYVVGKPAVRSATQTAGSALEIQEATRYNRIREGELLARFEMGKLDRLVLTWTWRATLSIWSFSMRWGRREIASWPLWCRTPPKKSTIWWLMSQTIWTRETAGKHLCSHSRTCGCRTLCSTRISTVSGTFWTASWSVCPISGPFCPPLERLPAAPKSWSRRALMPIGPPCWENSNPHSPADKITSRPQTARFCLTAARLAVPFPVDFPAVGEPALPCPSTWQALYCSITAAILGIHCEIAICWGQFFSHCRQATQSEVFPRCMVLLS